MCITIYLSIYKVFEFLSCRTKPNINDDDDFVYYNQKMERM
jgi:hypothetical protein